MYQHAQLVDVVSRNQKNPAAFPIPFDEEKNGIKVHDCVDLEVEATGLMVSLVGEVVEVRVTAIEGQSYHGVVLHKPSFSEGHGLSEGESVTFDSRYILKIYPLENEMISPSQFAEFDGEAIRQGRLHCMLNESVFFVVAPGDDFLRLYIESKLPGEKYSPEEEEARLNEAQRLLLNPKITKWLHERSDDNLNALVLDFPVEFGTTGQEVLAIVWWALQSLDHKVKYAEQE